MYVVFNRCRVFDTVFLHNLFLEKGGNGGK